MNGRVWAQEEDRILREMYPSHYARDIAKLLGRGVSSVYSRAFILKLKKDPEFLAQHVWLQKGSQTGAAYRFKKGQTPVNKGVKRPGWHAGRMKETQFKKGCRSGIAARNWVPVGTIKADTEGYLRIKVREAIHGEEATGYGNTKVWPLYNRYLWEQSYGPIPPSHIVAFKDGNRQNCVIENLELISMADNARRNSMWKRLPRELAQVVQLGGQLKRAINRKQRKLDATK